MAAALITLSLLIATYVMLLTYSTIQLKPMPTAVNGVMDLTAWRFEEEGAVRLDGQWTFYPNQLLTQLPALSSDAAGVMSPALIQVPGLWSKQMDTLGMATYRLQLQMGDTGAIYGLKTASILISNRLIVNGEIVGSSGNPAEQEHYKALNKPYVSYFTLQPGWNEILVQVANYEFRVGSGIGESLLLGKAEQMSGIRDQATAHDWIALTAFLIMGLYFIGLFSQRRNDFSLVVFGFVCLCIAVFTSVSGERVLFNAVGPFPFWLYFRIQMVSTVGVGLGFFFMFILLFGPTALNGLREEG